MTEPCQPHKRAGVRCGECGEYDPIDERILVVKLGAMGDVLRTTSCLPALRARSPRSHVTWVTRGDAVPLVENNPWIDRVLATETNYLELLMAEQFDLAIGPDADPLSASIMALASSHTKYGFVADGRGGVLPMNDAADHWWRMGLDDGLKRANRRTYGESLYAMCGLPAPVARPSLMVTAETAERAASRLRELGPGIRRWVCFNIGASGRWEQKRWRPAHYAELAGTIAANDPGAGILLLGGPEETSLHASLCRMQPAFVGGGTDNAVADFAALIAACEWTLTSDSLGYHVACAVGTPAACLVGPTSPWELDTFGVNCVIHPPLDCVACYLPKCPLSVTCMDVLTPDFVWTRIADWRRRLPRARLAVA